MKISITLIIVMVITNSCSNILNVTDYPAINYHPKEKYISKPVKFSIIQTGTASSQEAFLFRGGNLFKSKNISHISVFVKHDNKSFLFDTGLGSDIDNQFKKMPFIYRKMFGYSKGFSVKQQLTANGFKIDTIKTIILSHLHWDHASGIKDFPNATIYTTQEELTFAKSEMANPPAFLKLQYDGDNVNWKFLEFKKDKYEIFEESCDFFGDGSVVFVKLYGHTVGSIGMFINGPKRYFFTGDVTWKVEGFKRPSAKYFIPSNLVDLNKSKLNETIVKIHNLMVIDTTLIVIPAHDFDSQKELKHFPYFQ